MSGLHLSLHCRLLAGGLQLLLQVTSCRTADSLSLMEWQQIHNCSVTELGGWNQWLFWQQSYRRGCGSMGAWLSPWPCFLVSLQCLKGGI